MCHQPHACSWWQYWLKPVLVQVDACQCGTVCRDGWAPDRWCWHHPGASTSVSMAFCAFTPSDLNEHCNSMKGFVWAARQC